MMKPGKWSDIGTVILLTVLLLGYGALPQAAWVLMFVTVAVAWLRHGARAVGPARALLWFALPLLIGLVGIARSSWYPVVKDCWYFSKPLLELAFGYVMYRRLGLAQVVKVLFLAAALAAVHYTLAVVTDWEMFTSSDLYAIRKAFGPGSFLFIVPTVCLLDKDLRRLLEPWTIGRRFIASAGVVLGLSALALCGSRTVALSLVIAIALWLWRRHRVVAVTGIVSAVVILTATAIISRPEGATPYEWASGWLEEVTVRDYSSAEDINRYWRGYETFLALREFRQFDILHTVIGGGFGQTIQLEHTQVLGEREFDEIPLLHNGYLLLLVKVGILGASLFMGAMYVLWRTLRRVGLGGPVAGRLMPDWCVLVLLFTTAVIAGPYNHRDLMPILVFCGAYAATGYGVRNDSQDRVWSEQLATMGAGAMR